jgi:hypothetical protein
MKRPGTLHVHVWDYQLDMDNPTEELELRFVDTYANPDGYHQYGGTNRAGLYIEIRIPID